MLHFGIWWYLYINNKKTNKTKIIYLNKSSKEGGMKKSIVEVQQPTLLNSDQGCLSINLIIPLSFKKQCFSSEIYIYNRPLCGSYEYSALDEHCGKIQTEHVLYEGLDRHTYQLQYKIFNLIWNIWRQEGRNKHKQKTPHTTHSKTSLGCVFLKFNRNYKIST